MNFTEYLGQYKEAEACHLEKFPAFFARLKIARRLIKKEIPVNNIRNLNAPYYLSDLGVRKAEDPLLYARYIAEEFNTILPESDQIVEEIMTFL